MRGALIAVTTLLMGCGDPVYVDDGFDGWCDGAPCAWEAEGEIERVGTWHAKDYGVALVGDDVTLWKSFTLSEPVPCIQTWLLTDLQGGARLAVTIRLFDHAQDDKRVRVPDRNWEPLTFSVVPADWDFDESGELPGDVTIRKSGPGRAVVAAVRIAAERSCDAPEARPADQPLGAPCELDGECTSDVCESGLCSECSDAHPCVDGSQCGIDGSASHLSCIRIPAAMNAE